MTRGIYTVADLRARSVVDPVTGCWHWQGGNPNGSARIYTIDFRLISKRVMHGPYAVWNIAHQAPPRPGWLTFMRCFASDCVNPVHVDQARDRKAIGQHIRRMGVLKGTHLEARRANSAKGLMAAGVTPTPADVVLAIRASTGSSGSDLARQFGIAPQTVSMIRRGLSRRDVGVPA